MTITPVILPLPADLSRAQLERLYMRHCALMNLVVNLRHHEAKYKKYGTYADRNRAYELRKKLDAWLKWNEAFLIKLNEKEIF